jgi:hypothetical protein
MTRLNPSAATWTPRSLLKMAAILAFAQAAWAESLTGLRNATINVNGTPIPFKIEFSVDGPAIKGWFFNGDDHENSTSGKFSVTTRMVSTF